MAAVGTGGVSGRAVHHARRAGVAIWRRAQHGVGDACDIVSGISSGSPRFYRSGFTFLVVGFTGEPDTDRASDLRHLP